MLEKEISGLDGAKQITMNINAKVRDQGWGGDCASFEVILDDTQVFKSGPNGWWGDWGNVSFRNEVEVKENVKLDMSKIVDPKKILVKVHTFGGGCALHVNDLKIELKATF